MSPTDSVRYALSGARAVAGRPLLEVIGITKRYGRTVALRDASLVVAAGEVVALVGENGAGKSTLLRVCARLLAPDEGTVEVTDRIGYCPQAPGLIDLLSTEEHLVLFGRGLGLDAGGAVAAGHGILRRLGFRDDLGTQVRHLSGGNVQKLNLALALLGDPDLLLLDEPYQGFDHGTYVNFWDLVGEWRDEGRAIVVVTHLLAELHRADRVVELAGAPAGERVQ